MLIIYNSTRFRRDQVMPLSEEYRLLVQSMFLSNIPIDMY